MIEFSENTIRNWLAKNGLEKAVTRFDQGLKHIDAIQTEMGNGDSGDGVHLQIDCTDTESWIAAGLAGICGGAGVWFTPPGWTVAQKRLLNDSYPFQLYMHDDGWKPIHPGEYPTREFKWDSRLAGRLLIATGGSSGNTKFAIHHPESICNAVSGVRRQLCPSDVEESCFHYCNDLPVWHVSGWMQVMRSFLTDSHYFIGDGCREEWMKMPSGRFLSVVPTQLHRMLSEPEGRLVLKNADGIVVGGGPCPVGILDRCLEIGVFPWVTYGMTETLGMVAGKQISTASDLERGATVFPHASIRIETDTIENPDGVGKGEIVLQCEALCEGYLKLGDPRGVVDGLGQELHTRDLGALDEEGRLHVLGRLDKMIISGGEKINPIEVQGVIEAYPGIDSCVVVGLEHEEWGQQVVCLYVESSKTPVSATELNPFVKSKLESFKIPKHWIRVARLPFDEKGKIDSVFLTQILREFIANNP